ncbi:aspartate dehydrogenase [Ferrovibrio sp.]|uniref:aspartate dehydrogenase n=1 Tax=Ferrovibrio sp. TaxID=1917215 RepID=UPI00351407FE
MSAVIQLEDVRGSAKAASAPLRVAIAGLGTIGKVVAKRIDKGLDGCELVAVSVRNPGPAKEFLAELKSPVTLVELEDLPKVADVIIEALPASVFDTLAEPVLKAGRTLVVISVGTLVSRPHLFDLAREYGGKIVAPTGALIGLDAVKAAAEGTINSVRMVTHKPVKGLEGAPHLVKNNISLENLTEPKKVFEGTARDAVVGFPANVNVVAALSLAGIGADRTMIEIWADPASDRNRHRITVDSDSAAFSMEIANIPSVENPKTGKITALSIIAALKNLSGPVRIGT